MLPLARRGQLRGARYNLRAGRAMVPAHIQRVLHRAGAALEGERGDQAESAQQRDSVFRVRHLGVSARWEGLAASPAGDSTSARDVVASERKERAVCSAARVLGRECRSPLHPAAGGGGRRGTN